MNHAASTSRATPVVVVDNFVACIAPFEVVPVVVGSALEDVVRAEVTPNDRRGNEVADGVVDDPEAEDVGVAVPDGLDVALPVPLESVASREELELEIDEEEAVEEENSDDRGLLRILN